MKIVLIFLVICLLFYILFLFYILWISEYLIINQKRALLYFDRRGKDSTSRKITFSSCTGYTKRVLNLSKNHLYQFSFSSDITKGTAIAEIQDKNKNVLFSLDNIHPVQNLDTSQISRYYLVFRFQKADGTICLEWKEL